MKIFGTHDEKTLTQMREVDAGAVHAALMADGHFGYGMPIGGVAAYRNQVSPTGVGFDIACGNCAVKLDSAAQDWLPKYMRGVGEAIQNDFAFGVGRSNEHPNAPTDHRVFDSPIWDVIPRRVTKRNGKQWGMEALRQKARAQLGSIGSGNHYVDIFAGDDGHLWIGVHFGSRGLGHTIATWGMAAAMGGTWGDPATESHELLDLDTEIGAKYWALMSLAGAYAYAGREWVCREVADMIGGQIIDTVHNNHNYAWKERHFGDDLVVVRKGATPAFPAMRGFVGGSMGDDAVILKGSTGRDTPWPDRAINAAREKVQESSLYSTVHGAGRVMSRTDATGCNYKGKQIRDPRIDRAEMQKWLDDRGVRVFGADLDESPGAYRRLPDVLADQGDTITVETTLTPLVVVMASGRNELNPFLREAK